MSNNYHTPRERGSALLMSLFVMSVIAVFGGVIASQISASRQILQQAKIRSVMTQVEAQSVVLLRLPGSYTCTTQSASSCQLKQAVFDQLAVALPQGRVTAAFSFDGASLTANGQIAFVPGSTYGGMSLHQSVVSRHVPPDILVDQTFLCPDATPIFYGYDASGSPKCRAISATVCPTGSYISALDPVTLDPTCAPAGKAVACASTAKYISSFSWKGTATVAYSCSLRLDPYTQMSFTPPAVIDQAFNSQDPDIPDPISPYPRAPITVSWTAPSPQPTCSGATPSKINCVGAFDSCSATCSGTQTFHVTTASSGGGAACAYADGFIQACGPACPVPSPTATPAPTPTPSATPSVPSPTATPTPAPTATPDPVACYQLNTGFNLTPIDCDTKIDGYSLICDRTPGNIGCSAYSECIALYKTDPAAVKCPSGTAVRRHLPTCPIYVGGTPCSRDSTACCNGSSPVLQKCIGTAPSQVWGGFVGVSPDVYTCP